jgi:peroxiredoxin
LPSTIEEVQRAYSGRGLVVLAVNIAESEQKVRSWATERKLTMPVVLDPPGTISRAYQVTATPTVYVVDRDGRLVGRALGTKPWMGDKGRALLQALLGP